MKIDIEEQKILKEILEFDGSLHQRIKEEVKSRLVDTIVAEIENTYFKSGWSGMTDKIKDDVIEEIKVKQEEVIRKILSDFYDSIKYGRSDVGILKGLKDLLKENSRR